MGPLTNLQAAPADLLQARHRKGVLCYYQVGTGKTRAALHAAQSLLASNTVDRVIVIMPATLVKGSNVESELAKMREIGLVDKQRFNIGGRCSAPWRNGAPIACVDSYEMLQRMHSRGDFVKISPDTRLLVIVDEAHNISSAYTKTNGHYPPTMTPVVALCHQATKVLLLTATPIRNSALDILPLLGCMTDTTGMELETGGMFKNVSELYHRIGVTPQLVRETNDPDPGLVDEIVSSSYGRVLYAPAVGDFADFKYYTNDLRATTDRFTTWDVIMTDAEAAEHKRVGQDNGQFYTKQRQHGNESTEKPNIVYENMCRPEFTVTGGPVLIFSSFVKTGIDLIVKKLRDNGWINYTGKNYEDVIDKLVESCRGPSPDLVRRLKVFIVIDGESTNRDMLVNLFNKGVVGAALITKAGSEGVDLRGANGYGIEQVHIMDPVWNYSTLEQIKGRARRRGAHKPGSVINVFQYQAVCSDCYNFQTGDQEVWRICKDKQSALDELSEKIQEASFNFLDSRVEQESDDESDITLPYNATSGRYYSKGENLLFDENNSGSDYDRRGDGSDSDSDSDPFDHQELPFEYDYHDARGSFTTLSL